MPNPNILLPRRVLSAVTAGGALTAGAHNPIDATSGALTMTLPAVTSSNARARLSVEKADSSSNVITISGNIRGVAGASLTLAYLNEAIVFGADENGSWWPQAGHRSKASISTQIAAEAPAGGGSTAGKAGSFWHSTTQNIPATTVTQIDLGNTSFNDDTTYYTLASGAITVKKAGLYFISIFADCAVTGDSTAGVRTVFARINGNTIFETSGFSAGPETRLSGSRPVRLAANDVITLAAYYSAAGLILGAAAKDTGISIAYLGS